MILVETCHGGEHLGSVTHFAWPDPRIRQYHNHSAHGVRLCNALQLADRLGKLPPVVDVYGIDTGAVHRIDDVSPEIKRAVVELVDVVLAETNEAADAREVVC